MHLTGPFRSGGVVVSDHATSTTSHTLNQGVLVFSPTPSPITAGIGGDAFRLDPRSGVGLGVSVDVSLQPDPRTDPLFPLTPQVSSSVSVVGLSCDRPCLVSGLSPWGWQSLPGKEVVAGG